MSMGASFAANANASFALVVEAQDPGQVLGVESGAEVLLGQCDEFWFSRASGRSRSART